METQFFELELEYVDQAPGAIGERRGLEHGLLGERREIEVLRQEVDERLVVDTAAHESLGIDLAPASGEVAAHELGDASAQLRREHAGHRFTPADDRLAIRLAHQLLDDGVLPYAAQDNVEAAVGQLGDADHLADRTAREDGWSAVVVLLPPSTQESHADQTGAASRVPDHRPVTRLEDM